MTKADQYRIDLYKSMLNQPHLFGVSELELVLRGCSVEVLAQAKALSNKPIKPKKKVIRPSYHNKPLIKKVA